MMRYDWMCLLDILAMIFWCVVYIECIRIGIQQKTYAMPFIALCMNFCWEWGSLIDGIVNNGIDELMMVIYLSWGVLDIAILLTYFVYGKRTWKAIFPPPPIRGSKQLTDKRRSVYFIWITIGCILIVAGVFVEMYYGVENWKLYFAFGDNLLMSMLFIVMYYIRGGAKGQSLSIAVCKLIGTFVTTISMPVIGIKYGTIIGGMCLVLDSVYVYLIGKHYIQRKAVVA